MINETPSMMIPTCGPSHRKDMYECLIVYQTRSWKVREPTRTANSYRPGYYVDSVPKIREGREGSLYVVLITFFDT